MTFAKEAVEDLYVIEKEVTCLKCGSRGAAQFQGHYYPDGLGEAAKNLPTNYHKYINQPYFSVAGGFGGTIPHYCLNCGNTGLIEMHGLEGYDRAFTRDLSKGKDDKLKKLHQLETAWISHQKGSLSVSEFLQVCAAVLD